MLNLADSLKICDADYFLAPETAIDNDIWEDAFTNNYSLFEIRNFIEQHPYAALFFGAITYKDYTGSNENTPTMRYDSVDMIYYDVFNSAMQVDTSKDVQIYHKSKLALGAEKIPFPSVFRFFDRYLINLGGITGSLGEQKERGVFKHAKKNFIIAPVICYESVFGEYVTDYIKKGANLIFVITNDGWWGGTMGYTQHLRYSQLRAIETHRYIARCANTGISALINEQGEIVKATDWWQQTAISGTIRTNTKITFYVQYGDYIGRVAVFITICILLIGVGGWLRRHRST
jgi:apolipoprotein N-acyltransferase